MDNITELFIRIVITLVMICFVLMILFPLQYLKYLLIKIICYILVSKPVYCLMWLYGTIKYGKIKKDDMGFKKIKASRERLRDILRKH